MYRKKFLYLAPLAACAATAALIVPGAFAAGTSPRVTVRVEGLKHTLLAPTTVEAPATGSITKGGTPRGKCSTDSAAGALDVATHHRWGAHYSSSFGDIEVLSILGETHKFSSKYFWEIFVNNIAATKGACHIKLRKGQQLLFAAVPSALGSAESPTALTAPSHATSNVPFKVKVVWFNQLTHKAKPLAGAVVDGVKTNGFGLARITATHSGTLVLQATKKGFIRTAPVRVTVS
jgi:hypothetical protein